jgi:hypothetical protein
MIVRPNGVQAAIGRALGAFFRDDAGCVRPMAEGDRQHLSGRGHLQVEREVDLTREARDVVVGDVPTVLAQMGGDSVGSGLSSQPRGAHRIGMPSAARVPDGCDMVDIDAEAKRTLLH